MKNRERTEEQLRQASDHLYYEIIMFNSLAHVMTSGIAVNDVINNALLEAFGIHARVLIGSFYGEKPRVDDIMAEHFFSSPEEWKNARPQKNDILEKAENRANKEFAHLTYTRLEVTPEQKPWEFVRIQEELNKTIEKFLSIVPEHLLGSQWEDYKQKRKNSNHPTIFTDELRYRGTTIA